MGSMFKKVFDIRLIGEIQLYPTAYPSGLIYVNLRGDLEINVTRKGGHIGKGN